MSTDISERRRLQQRRRRGRRRRRDIGSLCLAYSTDSEGYTKNEIKTKLNHVAVFEILKYDSDLVTVCICKVVSVGSVLCKDNISVDGVLIVLTCTGVV